jgi:hypothetical protein
LTVPRRDGGASENAATSHRAVELASIPSQRYLGFELASTWRANVVNCQRLAIQNQREPQFENEHVRV